MTVSFRQPVGTGPVPACAGIGLRSTHVHEILENRPTLGWVEVHSENYFGRGIPRHYLEHIRERYPVSLHGVGLSVGSTDALSREHLAALRELIADIDPLFVSEHLSWSSVGGRYLNDLLPLPCTEEALAHVTARVGEIQERLGRQILIENISSYLQFDESAMPEWEFLAELANRSGCAVLLDVNNIYVSATNHGFDAYRYLQAIPVRAVREMHLAGFTRKTFDGGEILIDTHNRRVVPEVWRLYEAAVARFGAVPTLIEWDSDLPPLTVLLDEARQAQTIMETHHARAA
ncbi:MAG: DUF692 domain-containing protein [Gammaproteobacteria bacterium]